MVQVNLPHLFFRHNSFGFCLFVLLLKIQYYFNNLFASLFILLFSLIFLYRWYSFVYSHPYIISFEILYILFYFYAYVRSFILLWYCYCMEYKNLFTEKSPYLQYFVHVYFILFLCICMFIYSFMVLLFCGI